MSVRNACPFPVTVWAIAGPSFNLAPGEKKKHGAARIWFSCRAKGPGHTVNKGTFEKIQQDYINNCYEYAKDLDNYQEGDSGAFIGSLLGAAVGALEGVFKVQNTENGGNSYFGDKLEGVYGNSDLVVYCDMSWANDMMKDHKLYRLYLSHDHGQSSRHLSPPIPKVNVTIRATCESSFILKSSKGEKSWDFTLHDETTTDQLKMHDGPYQLHFTPLGGDVLTQDMLNEIPSIVRKSLIEAFGSGDMFTKSTKHYKVLFPRHYKQFGLHKGSRIFAVKHGYEAMIPTNEDSKWVVYNKSYYGHVKAEDGGEVFFYFSMLHCELDHGQQEELNDCTSLWSDAVAGKIGIPKPESD